MRHREGVVERIVRETTGSGNWPQLTKMNYDSWSLLMKLKLESRYLWEAIEDEDVDYHDDRSALEASAPACPRRWCPLWRPSHRPSRHGRQSGQCASVTIGCASRQHRVSVRSTS
jgi:hypothetical protein